MKALVIEKDAIRRNAAAVKARAGSAAIYAVLTGDGYGAGLVELARLLREEGIGRFAVSEPADAAALRKAGFVDEELLISGLAALWRSWASLLSFAAPRARARWPRG